jgi:hypothetical protein
MFSSSIPKNKLAGGRFYALQKRATMPLMVNSQRLLLFNSHITMASNRKVVLHFKNKSLKQVKRQVGSKTDHSKF